MKRYTKTILWLLLFFAVSAVIPPAMDADSHCKSSHDSAILSQSVSPVSPLISDPTPVRSRISSGMMPAGWHSDDIKNSKTAALAYYFSDQQSAIKSEITLYSLDCMLQI